VVVLPPPSKETLTGNDILAFLRKALPSVWTLEVLLLLKRTSGRIWRVEQLVAELRSSVVAVEHALTVLRAVDLIAERDGGYEYRPATPELDALVVGIAELYAVKPMTVIQAIAAAPNEKLIIFANAFKLKD
jgi:hypothetical protein